MGGRGIWSCAPCAFLLLSAVFPRDAAAMFQGDGRREFVHKIYKVKVIEDFLSEDTQLKKRAKDQCPTSYSLCPSSLGGDCCPDGYACAKKSCYATTAAVSTCAGSTGYYACPLSLGGGCCQQGLVCGTSGCNKPAGATYSQTCPTGYYLCPASASYGCCQSGMGCGISVCYNTSPSTSVIVIATVTDGSATTITSTTIVTPTEGSADSSATDAGAAAKVFPSTYEKAAATEGNSNNSTSDGKSGLTSGELGGIIGGAVALLLIVLAASFFIVKSLKRTERVVQSHRETTSGSGTRQTTEKKSTTDVSIVRIKPTPSEVDAMDYDPLMMSSSLASPRRSNQQPQTVTGRSRSGSDALSQPSGYSSSAAAARWNTPSVDSDGGDSIARGYFELPPRVHNHPGGRNPVRTSQDSSQYSYRHAYQDHGRQYSNASELSGGSDSDVRSQRGMGSPLIPATAIELGVDGGFVPELPGSDTETESIGPHGPGSRQPPRRPRRRSTGLSMNNIVTPMSTTMVNRPPSTHVNTGRRRGSSIVSPLDAQAGSGGQARIDGSVLAESRLGSIDESANGAGSAPTPNSMHGFFGSPTTAVGLTAMGPRDRVDFGSSTLPGFVPVWNPGDQLPIDHWDDEKQQG